MSHWDFSRRFSIAQPGEKAVHPFSLWTVIPAYTIGVGLAALYCWLVKESFEFGALLSLMLAAITLLITRRFW